MTTIKVSDETELINKLASYIEKISNDSIYNRGKFYIGLSGKFVFKGHVITLFTYRCKRIYITSCLFYIKIINHLDTNNLSNCSI